MNVEKCIGYLSGNLLKSLEMADLEKRIKELENISMEEKNEQYQVST